MSKATAIAWSAIISWLEKVSAADASRTTNLASEWPIRSILPSMIRRNELASNNANLMLDEPQLIVRMQGCVSGVVIRKFVIQVLRLC